MPPPFARGARLRVIGKLQEEDCINVMNFASQEVINDAPDEIAVILLRLATAMLECLVDTMLPATTVDYQLLGVETTLIHPTLSDPVFLAAPLASRGAGGPTSVSFAATLIQVRTGTGGRHGRGRNRWPPPDETAITNSAITTPNQDLWAAFIACVAGKFIGVGSSDSFKLGVLQKFTSDDPPQPVPFNNGFREATSMVLVPQVARCSSRKKGSGN